jgi:hypothetical protein
MSSASTRLLLFTHADLAGRALFRPLAVEVSVHPGTGLIHFDPSGDNRYTPVWQQSVQHLAQVGAHRYALPWSTTDLHVRPKGRNLVLDGRSASLPLFVAWVSLLSDRPLPSPFLATGVVLEGREELVPAPREYLQGKLSVADAYVSQVYPAAGRVPMWVPQGSDWQAEGLSALEIRPVASLAEGVRQVLGLEPRTSSSTEAKP